MFIYDCLYEKERAGRETHTSPLDFRSLFTECFLSARIERRQRSQVVERGDGSPSPNPGAGGSIRWGDIVPSAPPRPAPMCSQFSHNNKYNVPVPVIGARGRSRRDGEKKRTDDIEKFDSPICSFFIQRRRIRGSKKWSKRDD